ncbi:OmpA family protein, partial [Myxococcota bacterium]|nr:OmpA family protein [Myxococcota bacterium]
MGRAAKLIWTLAVLTLGALEARAAETVLPDGTVRFQSGSKDLTPESERVLDRLAKLLVDQPELDPVLLVGHADDRGNEALNRSLSEARAAMVRQSLIKRGIAPARLATRGAGS